MKHNHFQNALPVIASAIGDTLGVKVIFGGDTPCTDSVSTIKIPVVDSDDPEARIKALYEVVHEGSHIAETDPQVTPKKGMEHHLWNIIEDVRIESKTMRRFAGTSVIMDDGTQSLIASDYWGKLPEQASPAQIMISHIMYKSRLNVLGQEGFAELALDAETRLEAEIPLGVRTKLNALLSQIEQCNSSQDAHDLALAIIQMMEDEKKNEEEKEKQEEENQQSDSNEPDQSQSSQDQEEPQDPQDQDDQEGDQGSSDDEESEESSDEDEPPEQSGSGSPSNEDKKAKASEIIQQMLDAGEDEAPKDVGEALKEALGELYNPHVPSSTAPFQNIQYKGGDLSNNVITQQANEVGAACNALKVRAQSLLQAQTQGKVRSAFTGAKLNTRNLHMVKTGGPVFQKKTDGLKVDTAFAVLIDRSGSMSGQISLACDAALATTMAFERPDVKSSVFTFPYFDGEKEGNAVLKGWNQRSASAIPSYSTIGVDGCTPMAEAIMGVCMELIERKEPRKVLLVATDGDPDDFGKCSWVIQLARKSGIEVLGLGIRHDASKVFGQEWSEKIDSVATLPSAMIGMMDKVMLKAA